MLEPPSASMLANFAPGFGQRVLLTVDTEEEFDWRAPFSREGHGLSHVAAIPRFQSFCEAIGARPVYLVAWPIATNPAAVEIIGDAVRRGTAEVGMQLHPWVNPPFEEELSHHNSFPGNLPPALEAAKFTVLRDRVEEAFGLSPLIYRAGRYGLGPHTAGLLRAAGIRIDTSVRSLFDYSEIDGRDYTCHPQSPYWVDDACQLLELPLTTVQWGLLRNLGTGLQRLGQRIPRAMGVMARLSLLERIALTPEGVSAEEALRGIDTALDSGLPVLVLSLHSPSLAPGHTPYVATQADVEMLYQWLSVVYADLARRKVQSCTVADIIAATGG